MTVGRAPPEPAPKHDVGESAYVFRPATNTMREYTQTWKPTLVSFGKNVRVCSLTLVAFIKCTGSISFFVHTIKGKYENQKRA
jgi:hypothetical protein